MNHTIFYAIPAMVALLALPGTGRSLDPYSRDDTFRINQDLRRYAASYLAAKPNTLEEISAKVVVPVTLDPANLSFSYSATNGAVIRWPYTSATPLTAEQQAKLNTEVIALLGSICGDHPKESPAIFPQLQWDKLKAQASDPTKRNPFEFPVYVPRSSDSGDPRDPYGVASTFLQLPATEERGWYLPGFGYLPPWPHTLPRHTGSERYMGYLTPNGLYSPFLDDLDAERVRWFYHPRGTPLGHRLNGPATYIPASTDPSDKSKPDPFKPVKPGDRPVIPAELIKMDAPALRAEGMRSLKENRPLRALSFLTAATERDAEDTASWYLKAVAEWELGMKEPATESARRGQALELFGRDNPATVAKVLENVQGPSRRFLTETGASLTMSEARAILAKPSLTGLAAKTK